MFRFCSIVLFHGKAVENLRWQECSIVFRKIDSRWSPSGNVMDENGVWRKKARSSASKGGEDRCMLSLVSYVCEKRRIAICIMWRGKWRGKHSFVFDDLRRFRDTFNGKGGRRGLLERMALSTVQAKGYIFQVELAWRAVQLGATVSELPIRFSDRILGQSKLGWPSIIEGLMEVPKMCFRGSTSQ